MRKIVLSLLTLTGLWFWASGSFSVQTEREEAKAEKEKALLLKDYQPKAMVRLPAHAINRARFPVIDVHNHVNDARRSTREKQDPDQLVRMMDDLNLRKIVILTGGWGDELQKVVDGMVKRYPERFMVFTQIDWSRIDEPRFGELMAGQIRDAVAGGARGLKILKELGLQVRDKSGKLVSVDDPRLDPVWAECGKLGIPVAIHVTDPVAFFQPLDRFNERYEELIRHPDWHFCCPPKFPTKEAILDARNRVVSRHPDTTFILLHVGNWPENLDSVEDVLRRYPNTVVEFGAREAELGRQPRRARDFFLNNADRILFGTDHAPSQEMYRNHFRWLETADEYFDYWGYPNQGRWKIYGLELPDKVLAKIYHENAERIFSQFKVR
jgi:predicted TIM-barrel fold metal-dependent hydrolase